MVSERVRNVHWKRASIMDQLQFDVFQYYYRKHRPDFSTFFANSTAHFQHCYWRHMEPEKFDHKPNETELRTYRNAILHGYKSMDKLMGKFMRLAGNDATLIFCTALSQQPFLDYEQTGGRHYYRLQNERQMRETFGITQEFTFEPVMAEQFLLRFEDERQAETARQHLLQFKLSEPHAFANGNPQLFHITASDAKSLMCQCRCTGAVSNDALIIADSLDSAVPFRESFYAIESVKSGQHHPDGMLWIRQPNRVHLVGKDKLSLRRIAPMILNMFDVSPPEYMLTKNLVDNRLSAN